MNNSVDLGEAKGKVLLSSLNGSEPDANTRSAEIARRVINKDSPKLTKDNQYKQYGFNYSNSSRVFNTGAQRDAAENKPRPDLISPFATMRKGTVMELGAKKYGYRNWEKGMPLSVFLASATRHLNQFMMGDMEEDHLAHCSFNLDAIMHGQEMIKRGLWPKEYDDLPRYESPTADNNSCSKQ